MSSDNLAKQLHDKSTRGESLSAEEQLMLENWYATQDRAESAALGLMEDEQTASSLQSQIESALTQLTVVTTRIQDIAAENNALRHDVGHLRQQLAHQPAMQLA